MEWTVTTSEETAKIRIVKTIAFQKEHDTYLVYEKSSGARSYLKNDEDVADAMSETVLQAFEHIGDLQHTEFFKTWLIRINQCKVVLQKQKRYVLTEEMDERELEENSFSDVYFPEVIYCMMVMM